MKPQRCQILAATALLVAFGVAAAGCASIFSDSVRKTDRSSTLVSYLYPGEQNPLPPTDIPVLHVPLRVGIAFVPAGGRANGRVFSAPSGITELKKNELMRRVATEFKGRDYIQSIEIIPSSYLRPGGGFANLDQVRALLNVDVVALIAYDQEQFTKENLLSLSYWTIVGAYIFKGNANDTHTLMEAAVYDIPSRHLLFRAGGPSLVQANSAAKYVQGDLQADSVKGFDLATAEMTKNLAMALDEFRERVKNAPGEVQVVRRPGYSGSGDFGPAFAGFMLLLGGVAWLRRRK